MGSSKPNRCIGQKSHFSSSRSGCYDCWLEIEGDDQMEKGINRLEHADDVDVMDDSKRSGGVSRCLYIEL